MYSLSYHAITICGIVKYSMFWCTKVLQYQETSSSAQTMHMTFPPYCRRRCHPYLQAKQCLDPIFHDAADQFMELLGRQRLILTEPMAHHANHGRKHEFQDEIEFRFTDSDIARESLSDGRFRCMLQYADAFASTSPSVLITSLLHSAFDLIPITLTFMTISIHLSRWKEITRSISEKNAKFGHCSLKF